MYSLVITGVRLENHLRSPVMESNRSRSTKIPPCLPPAKSKTRARVSKRLHTGVSTKRIKLVSCHFLKHGVSKIHPISPRWNTHTSPWRTTRTTKGRSWPVALWDLKLQSFPHTRIGHERRNVQQTHHTQTQHAYHHHSVVAHLEAQTHASPEGKWYAPYPRSLAPS
jgi:hypothetical protein